MLKKLKTMYSKIYSKGKGLVAGLMIALMTPSTVFANGLSDLGFDSEGNLTGLGQSTEGGLVEAGNKALGIIKQIQGISVGIGIGIVVITVIAGGVALATSRGNPQKRATATQWIMYALGGAAVIGVAVPLVLAFVKMFQ